MVSTESVYTVQLSMLILLSGHILEIQSKAMGVMPGPGAGSGQDKPQSHLFFIDDLSMSPSVGGQYLLRNA